MSMKNLDILSNINANKKIDICTLYILHIFLYLCSYKYICALKNILISMDTYIKIDVLTFSNRILYKNKQ